MCQSTQSPSDLATLEKFNPFEFLNDTFGIHNDVSVPIVISLLVFIVGGVAGLIFNSIKNYLSRRRQRISFRNVINEVKLSSKRNSKNILLFYPTLNERHTDTWKLIYSRISYLEVASKLDYSLIYNSFSSLFIFRTSKNIRAKSLNKIWAVLGNLKFIESLVEENYKTFITEFNLHENKYGEYLEELRKHHDNQIQNTQGKTFPKPIADYFMAQDKIWVDWQKEINPTFYQVSYTKLVKPLLDINRSSQNIPYILEQNNILLPATYEYNEIVSKLKNYREVFLNHFHNYKNAGRIIDKCLEFIS